MQMEMSITEWESWEKQIRHSGKYEKKVEAPAL